MSGLPPRNAEAVSWDNGRYLVLLSQYKEIPVGTWWYWPSIGQYWLVRVGTETGFGLYAFREAFKNYLANFFR